jgi:hypothetical protein
MAGEKKVQFSERLNYFDGLFLDAARFKLEADHHVKIRRSLNYLLFNGGVLYTDEAVEPLEVSVSSGTTIAVAPGSALVRNQDGGAGYEVHIESAETLDLSDSDYNLTDGETAYITIGWEETTESSAGGGGGGGGEGALVTGDDLTREYAVLGVSKTPPAPLDPVVLLAEVAYHTAGITGSDITDRRARGGLRYEILSQDLIDRLGAIPTPPTLASFTPISGGVGTVVTITGSHFTGATAVSFGGIDATTFTVDSESQITATVPPGATTGRIRVTTPAGSGESTVDFTVTAPVAPTITNFTPTSGAVGTVVTITGSHFTGATAVSFGGIDATAFTVDSESQITATVPPAAVTGRIRVTTPAGSAESATDFTVVVAVPQPVFRDPGLGDQFLPRSAPAGSPIKIFCSNFFEGDPGSREIRFGSIPVSDLGTLVQVGDGIENVIVPPGVSGLVKITLTNEGGDDTSDHDFIGLD